MAYAEFVVSSLFAFAFYFYSDYVLRTLQPLQLTNCSQTVQYIKILVCSLHAACDNSSRYRVLSVHTLRLANARW